MPAKPAPRKRAPRAPKQADPIDPVEDLRADYDRLGRLLANEDDGAKAAALARERRLIRELLDSLQAPKGVPVVDQLAARRRAGPGATRAASRRRQPG